MPYSLQKKVPYTLLSMTLRRLFGLLLVCSVLLVCCTKSPAPAATTSDAKKDQAHEQTNETIEPEGAKSRIKSLNLAVEIMRKKEF